MADDVQRRIGVNRGRAMAQRMHAAVVRRRVVHALAALVAVVAPTAAVAQAAAASPAVTAASAVAPTTSPASIPAARFFQPPRLAKTALSPNGRRVAAAWTSPAGRLGLALLDVEPGVKAGKLIADPDIDIVAFAWTSDDRLVFSVLDLARGEDAQVGLGLVSVRADGRDMRLLVETRFQGFVTEHRDGTPALNPNHRLLHVPAALAAAGKDTVIVGALAGRGRQLVEVVPMWLDAASGATWGMANGRVPAGAMQWWFDSQGTAWALRTEVDGVHALHVRERRADGSAGEGWTKAAQAPLSAALPFMPVRAEDDGTLFVTVTEGLAGMLELTTLEASTLQPRRPTRVAVPGFDFRGDVVVAPDGGRVLGVRVDADAETTVWSDAAAKRLQAMADARWPGRVNRLDCVRCGADDAVALVHSFSDRDPGRVAVYRARDGKWVSLGQVREGIDAAVMAEVELHRVAARDGLELPVWVTRPAGARPGQPLPTVVLVHGGPWVRDGHWRWEPMAQFLAARGWQVMNVEFRGSTGYGARHFDAGRKQWGRAMQDDLEDALAWARRSGLADDRACVAGASYGGYAALMAVTRETSPFRCAASWVGVTDLPLYVQGSWWVVDDIGSAGRQFLLPEWVGDPVKDADALRAHSPVNLAERIRVPVLLAYGGADRRVPMAHGTRLRDALTKAGRAPEWIVYDDEGHGWRTLATQVDFAQRLEVFLARHLAH